MKSIVSRDGRITIDQRARHALDVKPGMVAVQILIDGHLEVHFIAHEHDRSLFGVLRVPPGTEIPPWDVIRENAAEAIAEDAMRRVSPWPFTDDERSGAEETPRG